MAILQDHHQEISVYIIRIRQNRARAFCTKPKRLVLPENGSTRQLNNLNCRIHLQSAHKRFGHACDRRLKNMPDNFEEVHLEITEIRRWEGYAMGQARRKIEERRPKDRSK